MQHVFDDRAYLWSSHGNGRFAAAGPRLWSSDPAHLRKTNINFKKFKRLLKSFLFECSEIGMWAWLTVNLHLLSYIICILTKIHVEEPVRVRVTSTS